MRPRVWPGLRRGSARPGASGGNPPSPVRPCLNSQEVHARKREAGSNPSPDNDCLQESSRQDVSASKYKFMAAAKAEIILERPMKPNAPARKRPPSPSLPGVEGALGQSYKYFKLMVRFMGSGKNKIFPTVDDEAKKNLVMYQAEEGLRTRDDAVEKILHMLPTWKKQEKIIEELTAKIAELESPTD